MKQRRSCDGCFSSDWKLGACLLACLVWFAAPGMTVEEKGQTFRLCDGVTILMNNEKGQDFTVNLDLRDLNLFSNGPREVLFKVYDPDGKPVVREVIPDDGVTTPNFPERIGGWDHELQYYANLYAKGTTPSFRYSAWSEPGRLAGMVKRTFTREIKGGKKGVYRVVLAGTPDHFATLEFKPAMKYGVAGHPNFLCVRGNELKKSFIYVPKGTSGIFFAAVEPDRPSTRHFKVTAPDGKVLFDKGTVGGYVASIDGKWQDAAIKFEKLGQYDGQLLTMEVSEGTHDYLVKLILQLGKDGAFKDYVGMGTHAVFAPDAETAMALRAGTSEVDGLVFWHPFQARFYAWLQANKLDANDQEKALRKELEALFNSFRLMDASDGRGSMSWVNWAYAFGYYGCRIWRPGWLLMQKPEVPPAVKEIIREGLIVGGDRLSFAVGMERVNGNAFAQIPVALWYGHQATGDPLQKERFETFFDRWQHEGWGTGVGLSPSGDAQEHFAHDMHYGSYLMDNWKGVTWVKEGGILTDAKDDPRFQKIVDRYRDLYSYLYCREIQTGKGASALNVKIPANPWSSRTHMSAHLEHNNWEVDGRKWMGEPGPDFTVSVNGGNEWFAARRKNYYFLSFHGRLAPEWISQCFPGQVGFGGGEICQFTIPGKGPVIASTLHKDYGEGMHPSQWRGLHIHSIVGEMWDGTPFVSGISEHENARLEGNTVSSSGEVRNTHVKVARKYTFQPDGVDCEVSLAESDYAHALSIWSHERLWSEVKFAWEMIPVIVEAKRGATQGTMLAKVILQDASGKDLGEATLEPVEASKIRLDRGGYGVEIQLEKPAKVRLGEKATVLIQVLGEGPKPFPAADVMLKYRLVPFGASQTS